MGAKQGGYEMIGRSANEIIVKNNLASKEEKYKVLAEFPFDSTRKRMSLVIEVDSQYFLMCKGADSIVLPRCIFNSNAEK